MAVVIDDSPNGMLTVLKANEQFDYENTLFREYGIYCRKRKVIGILFDPYGIKKDVKADYKIKNLREVLNIFYL